MSDLAIENRKHEPKNFFAGEFQTLTETSTADKAMEAYTPVCKTDTGVAIATKETLSKLVGITAASVDSNEPVVYYMTGEFFADAINVPAGITADELKTACRTLSIFLR